MEYNNAGKKGLRDGKERILDVTAAAASAAAENLPRRIFEGEARTQASLEGMLLQASMSLIKVSMVSVD